MVQRVCDTTALERYVSNKKGYKNRFCFVVSEMKTCSLKFLQKVYETHENYKKLIKIAKRLLIKQCATVESRPYCFCANENLSLPDNMKSDF